TNNKHLHSFPTRRSSDLNKHENYSSLEDEEIRKQIQTAHQTLLEATGKAPHLIRLPNGDFDQRVLRIANELNYTVIQWDTDSLRSEEHTSELQSRENLVC